jgi:hypothetical protein
MSLEDLLAQDTCTLRKQTVTQDTSGGSVRARSDRLKNVPCRIAKAKGSEFEQYMSLGMICHQIVYTKEPGFVKGDVILTSDGRTLRMEAREQVNSIGNLPTYFRYPCSEVQT